jgi:peptidoglycan hydrolase CwlO-like protein
MIDKQVIDNLITKLQEFAASYREAEAFAAKHAKAKAEHDVVARELAQFRQALSDLQRQYSDQRHQVSRLDADITRRSQELARIDGEIAQAKQRAFGYDD